MQGHALTVAHHSLGVVRRPPIFVKYAVAQVNACCDSLSYVFEPRRTLCFPRLPFAASIYLESMRIRPFLRRWDRGRRLARRTTPT